MKRIFYGSLLAKVILFFSSCHTITIGPFVLSKLGKWQMRQCVRNHECTHSRQWIELTVISGLFIWIIMLLGNIPAWWMLLSALAFYIWYGVEWGIRLLVLRDAKKAYRAVSFEREAYGSEYDETYLENCNYFTGWFKYLKTGWKR